LQEITNIYNRTEGNKKYSKELLLASKTSDIIYKIVDKKNEHIYLDCKVFEEILYKMLVIISRFKIRRKS